MKMKKWLKCLLMMMALMMVVNVGAVSTTIPAEAKAETETVKKGTKFWSGKLQYKVTSLKGKKGTASLIGAKSNVTSVTVPKTVKKGKYTLTVTVIGANAFKNCKKLETVTTNTVIKEIGKNAFKGCKQLTTLDIKSKKLGKVGKNALKGISKKAVVTVPSGKEASYEKILNVSVQEPETEAQQASETVKAPETEAPKAQETETQKSAETEAPKAQETETQKSAETEAPTPTPEKKAEAETTPAPAPTPEEKAEAETTPAPTLTPEEKAEAETTPAPAPTPEEKVEAETTPAPAPTPEEKAEAETTPAPAPTLEEKVKAETTPTPAPTPEEKAEAETTPTPAPIPEEKAEAETTPAPAPTPKKRVEKKAAPKSTVKPEESETATTPETTTTPKTEAPQTVPGILEGPSFEEPAETKPATCGEKHLDLKVVESVAPTCTEPGRSSYEYCTVCGYKTEPIEIAALGHSYGDWIVTEAATCTEPGTEEKTCTTCGAKETRTVAAKGHTLGEETIEPIPGNKEYGRIVRRCTSCDYVEKSNYSVHRTDVYVPLEDIPATCTQSGKTNRRYCPYCKEERFSYVKPLGHKYSDERTYEEGTCVTPGISYRKCVHDGCNARIDVQETTKAEGHQWEDCTIAATCTQSGFEGRKCKLCGTLDGKETAPLGHKFETRITEATCKTNGTEEETCSVCGSTKVTVLSAVGEHQWVEHPAKEASCVEDGHSAFTQCSVCGAYKDNVEPEIYKADGQHTWVPDIAVCNFMSAYSVPNDKCGCESETWNDVFKKCEDCLTTKIDTVLQGHEWEKDESESCSYVKRAKNDQSGSYDDMSFYILSASFLVKKTDMEHMNWKVPGDSANIDVFDVKINGTDYVCVDIRRRAEGLFSYRARDMQISGYTWVPVTGVNSGIQTEMGQYVGSNTPFCMLDHRVFVAVAGSEETCRGNGWTEMNIQKDTQTETNAASESATEKETDLTAAAPNMEEIAADAAETPKVIHGETEIDLFGTKMVSDPGHEPHDITHHEDPLVESEDTAAHVE